MNLEELLDLLDIDGPEDFAYFEHLAELLEQTEDIAFEPFYKVLSAIPLSDLNELLNNYFEDILSGVPDDALDFYTLLETIHRSLSGLTGGKDPEEGRRRLIEELYRFRNWYILEGQVECTAQNLHSPLPCSICEALALYRLEKLGEVIYDYDFSGCEEYAVDEYVMALAVEDDDDCQHGHCSHGSRVHDDDRDDDDWDDDFDEYEEGLIDPHNPVIDGEFSD